MRWNVGCTEFFPFQEFQKLLPNRDRVPQKKETRKKKRKEETNTKRKNTRKQRRDKKKIKIIKKRITKPSHIPLLCQWAWNGERGTGRFQQTSIAIILM